MTEVVNASPEPSQRNRLLLLLGLVVGATLIGWAGYWWLHGRFHEVTEDAYVAGHVVQVSSQVTGTVTGVAVVDTDLVKVGTLLVKLDETDARVALENAEAALARAVRDVRSLFANQAGLAAVTQQRELDLARARDDLRRRQDVAGSGALSAEELAHAQAGYAAAEAALKQAREQFAANAAQTAGTRAENHPTVAAAAARYKEAYLNHHRTEIPAPVTGLVAKRTVQTGQRVSPGSPLMAVVPLDAVWVDANFKEVQLRQMRIGQPAILTADLYGRGTEYHGRVAGIGAGTGSAFAILPAQNATGNWIKLVQRVPVHIVLDPRELAVRPLRIGLSMSVDIDTQTEPAAEATLPPPSATPVSEGNTRAMAMAEQRVGEIIAAHLAATAAR